MAKILAWLAGNYMALIITVAVIGFGSFLSFEKIKSYESGKAAAVAAQNAQEQKIINQKLIIKGKQDAVRDARPDTAGVVKRLRAHSF